ncbi:uncharacterized protein K489DRAFT_65169 [Dissoconium aciculare CBS 342.82]|uniref:Uncharacterized protein n=1 Tax=Dissoconium aciculare CBS 342.82 TaxID=1314786 RepID=A0A6J3LUC1_9PEZI|nr:uncharacterized protein K489DRAFT_65169 [Dissoconium aciculare CBS 342.82]KAF1819380.1 hypothetical protein K489DRAFT_65169 [Dissoconium aciculare CBS 342.82]
MRSFRLPCAEHFRPSTQPIQPTQQTYKVHPNLDESSGGRDIARVESSTLEFRPCFLERRLLVSVQYFHHPSHPPSDATLHTYDNDEADVQQGQYYRDPFPPCWSTARANTVNVAIWVISAPPPVRFLSAWPPKSIRTRRSDAFLCAEFLRKGTLELARATAGHECCAVGRHIRASAIG